jgi:hypothetical protein
VGERGWCKALCLGESACVAKRIKARSGPVVADSAFFVAPGLPDRAVVLIAIMLMNTHRTLHS